MLSFLIGCVLIGDEEWSQRIDWDQDGTHNANDCAPRDPDVEIPRWWLDADGDGVGGGAESVEGCEAPVGYVAETGDCDDAEPSVFPGAPELCDLLDNDCNDLIDDAEDTNPWYTTEVCSRSLADADSIFSGEEAGDNAGRYVAHAFDHDGDGVNDLFTASPTWQDDAGRGYLIYGPPPAGATDLGDSDAFFDGQGDDRIGRMAGGDLDGDGADEIAVAALRRSVSFNKDGAVLVFPGGERFDGVVDEAAALAVISGAGAWSRLGATVALPGDLTGDGTADLLVSSVYDAESLGVAYLMAGPLEDATSDDAVASISGVLEGGQIGARLHGLGDLDGDGQADMAVADPVVDRVWIFHGPLEGAMDTDDADVEWLGQAGTSLGQDLGVCGDWTGDGVPDLVVGVPSDSHEADKSGAVYLLDGTGDGGLAADRAVATFYDEQAFANAGHAVNCDGDADGDGRLDLLVGANFHGANESGVAYLVYGFEAEGFHSFRLADARFEGDVGDQAGSDVLLADLDGDASAEVVVSSPTASGNGTGSGGVWLMHANW